MPFEIIRNDIVNMQVDAVVNTANPHPVIGTGVDSGIHKKAGQALLEARQKIGHIAPGDAAITPGFGLDAKYVIHTVGPIWEDGRHREEEILASCYRTSLKLAGAHACESVAFPLLATGNYGFPKPLALQIAVREISTFLLEHEMQIYLVVFDKDAFALSEKLFKSVSSYIDEHYISSRTLDEYGTEHVHESRRNIRRFLEFSRRNERTRGGEGSCPPPAPIQTPNQSAPLAPPPPAPAQHPLPTQAPVFPAPQPSAWSSAQRREAPAIAEEACEYMAAADLGSMLEHLDAGFSETLLKLIDRTGKKDSEIYKKANVDRKLFSKIRNNPDYKPSKATALAFAFALELDIEETKDFIGRAGFALSHSSKFDVIVEYFLVNGNYDVFELNEVLFAFDQPLIGA